MKPILFVVLLLCAASSLEAQGGRGPCSGSPVDPAVVSGVVYRDCDVDRPARPRSGGGPRINWSPSPSDMVDGRCYRADFEFVVDSLGGVEPLTVRMMSSNNTGYAEAVRASLASLRFEPARLDDRPVRQLVAHAARVAVRASVGGAPSRGSPLRC